MPKSPLGWHLRPAGMLAGVANMFHSEIEAKFGMRIASAKSLMGLITLEAGRGARLYITARGCDAKQAIQAIKSRFSGSVKDVVAEGECASPSAEGARKAQSNDKKDKPKEAGMTLGKTMAKLAGRGMTAATTITCAVKPEAKRVFVAGDFNGWDPQVNAMTRRAGQFVKSIKLPPGEHQYKFIIDGEWHVDPSAPTVLSTMGTINNVVRV